MADNSGSNLAVALMTMLVALAAMLCAAMCAWICCWCCGDKRARRPGSSRYGNQRQRHHQSLPSSSDHPLLSSDSGIEVGLHNGHGHGNGVTGMTVTSMDLPHAVCMSTADEDDVGCRSLNMRPMFGELPGAACAPPPNRTIDNAMLALHEAANSKPPPYDDDFTRWDSYGVGRLTKNDVIKASLPSYDSAVVTSPRALSDPPPLYVVVVGGGDNGGTDNAAANCNTAAA